MRIELLFDRSTILIKIIFFIFNVKLLWSKWKNE